MSTTVEDEERFGVPPEPVPAAPAAGFRPPNLALATIGLALASFMQVLDTTIANVSLPTISGKARARTRRRG
jgi:MFS transporter, DHA2 family, multidrug resistance protein